MKYGRKNAQGFTVFGRDKDDNTIWLPFPKELMNSRGIFHQHRTEYTNGNVVIDITYFDDKSEKMPEFKEYMAYQVVCFTLGENDVNLVDRIKKLKKELQAALSTIKDLLGVL